MKKEKKIYIAGHAGLVGSAILRQLRQAGYQNLVFRTHSELDLTDLRQAREFLECEQPECIILAAAKVGGIMANKTYPVEFLNVNLAIQSNIILSAAQLGIQDLIFLGSSCIYPRDCPQPIKEEYLLTGPLELTNRAYAVAKIAGIELCSALNRQYGTEYFGVMPTNLYGPGDNYSPDHSHVLPGLMRRIHEAKLKSFAEVTVWGTGKPKREMLYTDDLARGCIKLLLSSDNLFKKFRSADVFPIINIGSGNELTIKELAEKICEVVGYQGRLVFDHSKPDGTPRKVLDSNMIRSFGWRPTVALDQGIQVTYQDFLTRTGSVPVLQE